MGTDVTPPLPSPSDLNSANVRQLATDDLAEKPDILLQRLPQSTHSLTGDSRIASETEEIKRFKKSTSRFSGCCLFTPERASVDSVSLVTGIICQFRFCIAEYFLSFVDVEQPKRKSFPMNKSHNHTSAARPGLLPAFSHVFGFGS